MWTCVCGLCVWTLCVDFVCGLVCVDLCVWTLYVDLCVYIWQLVCINPGEYTCMCTPVCICLFICMPAPVCLWWYQSMRCVERVSLAQLP